MSLGLTKWLMLVGSTTTLDDHLQNEALAMELSSRSEDFREGLKAFTDRRPPEFTALTRGHTRLPGTARIPMRTGREVRSPSGRAPTS